jgi:peptide-methionine (R)-S-oxide reductase
MADKVVKTDEEWKAILTPEQYAVARQKGTERAFTGKYYDNHDKGIYLCVCCGNELFTSDTKYDSGCGWPSFYAPLDESKVAKEVDKSSGQRFCMNSASLDFAKKEPGEK